MILINNDCIDRDRASVLLALIRKLDRLIDALIGDLLTPFSPSRTSSYVLSENDDLMFLQVQKNPQVQPDNRLE